MKLENLSDKDLEKIARNIETENKRRANRKAAATAIIAVLKKYKLSINDIPELKLGKRSLEEHTWQSNCHENKRSQGKSKAFRKTDKRLKVAYKYKNPKGKEKWSGRGRAPKWVTAILENNRISIAQFKASKRYKIGLPEVK